VIRKIERRSDWHVSKSKTNHDDSRAVPRNRNPSARVKQATIVSLAHLRAFMLELPHMLIRLSGISRNESAGVPARLTARESETMPTTCNMKKSKELRRSLEHPPVRR